MSVQCLDCVRMNLRGSAMSKHAFGHCALQREQAVFVSISFERECAHHKPVKAEESATRKKWLDNWRAGKKTEA